MSQSQSGGATPWGAIAQGVSGLIGLIGQRRRQKRQHAHNMELAEYSYDRQYQMWDEAWRRETEYNDPSAQMARYKKAGINPHMAYMTGGGQNTASTGELPKFEAQTTTMAPSGGEMIGGLLSKYLQNQQIINQLRKEKALTRQEEVRAVLMETGLSQKKQRELELAGNMLMKERQGGQLLYGDRGPGTLTRYQEGVAAEVEFKTLQNLLSKAQAQLAKATGDNLVSNDQLVQIQTDLARAQFDFVNSPEFSKLPSGLQGILLALARKFGGM